MRLFPLKALHHHPRCTGGRSRSPARRIPVALGNNTPFGSHPRPTDGTLKLFEELFYVSHRNRGVLSGGGLVKSLLRRGAMRVFRRRSAIPCKRVIQCATTSEARQIFQQVVKCGETLDGEILGVIWFWDESRWLQDFSMEFYNHSRLIHLSGSLKTRRICILVFNNRLANGLTMSSYLHALDEIRCCSG